VHGCSPWGDLDRQPGIKNAAFQVWGEKDAPQGEKAHPLNLGILYMDGESNCRWVLRLDDPKQLPEIDAVFVTVEPHGGSRKPTSKPFLYALLRKGSGNCWTLGPTGADGSKSGNFLVPEAFFLR
jgi:hypothetical protein